MVNGRSLEEELKRISDIFDGLSLREFDDMMKRNGYDENDEISENSRAYEIQRKIELNELRMCRYDTMKETVKYRGKNRYKRKTDTKESVLFTMDRNRIGAA